MILTDGSGRPFDRPEPPASGAPIDDVLAWMRALASFNDAVRACACRAFDAGFKRAIRTSSQGNCAFVVLIAEGAAAAVIVGLARVP
jgi:hypothetical protein